MDNFIDNLISEGFLFNNINFKERYCNVLMRKEKTCNNKYGLSDSLYSAIKQYIEERYIDEYPIRHNYVDDRRRRANVNKLMFSYKVGSDQKINRLLKDTVNNTDETFF